MANLSLAVVMSTSVQSNIKVENNIIQKPKTVSKTVGIVMAAGRGSRMKPLTDTQPKPLARYRGGETLLEINLNMMLPLVDEIVIVLHYLGQQIEDFIGNEYKGIPVYYTWSDGPTTGTLDAFRQGIYTKSEYKNSKTNFLVVNSDNICGVDYYSQLQRHIQTNSDMTYLLATEINNKEILQSSGVFVIDSNHNLIKIVEKPQDYISNLVNIGIYYLPNFVFDLVESTRPNTDSEEFITDLFNLINTNHLIKIISSQDTYIPITTVDDLELN